MCVCVCVLTYIDLLVGRPIDISKPPVVYTHIGLNSSCTYTTQRPRVVVVVVVGENGSEIRDKTHPTEFIRDAMSR